MVSTRMAPRQAGKLRRFEWSDLFINLVILLAVLICVIPVWHIVALSVSGRTAVLSGQVWLVPKDIDWNAYISVFNDTSMQRALVFSVILTAVYTALAMLFSVLLAYPLSKRYLPGVHPMLVFILIPMYFTGGVIPQYLWVKRLGLLDNPWALVWPILVSTYNTIILRNFFQSIPDSLEESARLDGCNDFGILFRIVMPLSTAALATISLFYAVSRWNSYTDVLYYINSSKWYTLQWKLYQVVFNSTDTEVNMLEGGRNAVLAETVKSAAIVFSTVPILIVYPFLQKYFVQGVMIGAIKE
jgi:putative aldouronate transport system permease protein